MSDQLKIVGIIALIILTIIFVVAILMASRYRPPTQLALIIGVLASITLGGYIAFGDQRTELVALAGTCIGALASALTITFKDRSDHLDEITKVIVDKSTIDINRHMPPAEEETPDPLDKEENN